MQMRLAVFTLSIIIFVLLIIVALKDGISNKTLKKLSYVATIVAPLAAILALIIPPPIRNPGILPTPSPNLKVVSSGLKGEEASVYNRLSEEQIRREIGNLLEKENVDKAIRLLSFLHSETAKEEECDHIFNYCLKNGKLDEAEEAAKLFVSSSKKEKALNDVALEKIKR